jgi:NAD(P)-dependent dehydrogenase (short-subunit alcohol dehydrogenase family)
VTSGSASISGKVAVVTGATRGIGRHVALALADAGAAVVVVGRTSRCAPHSTLTGSVEETVDELTARGVEALGVQADLSDEVATQRIIDETLNMFGRCDILVNNAAYTSNGSIFTVPWQRWQRAFRVQVVAPLQLSLGFLPGMIEQGDGRILNVSSGASQALTPGLALYSTSKLAMERWSDYVDLELDDDRISVNTLRVDRIVATEGWQHVADTQGIDVATGGGSMDGIMQSNNVAQHVLWMLQQPATWSGQTVGFEHITAMGGPTTPPFATED